MDDNIRQFTMVRCYVYSVPLCSFFMAFDPTCAISKVASYLFLCVFIYFIQSHPQKWGKIVDLPHFQD